jgi:hypothetical protein
MPEHKDIVHTSCSHGTGVVQNWSRYSTPLDWGRRKVWELSLIEAMWHTGRIRYPKDTIRYYRVADSERRFEDLFKNWIDETGHLSSSARIVSNQYYLGIVAMGPQALTPILRRLRNHPEPWFPALVAITRENPVKPEDQGQFQRMRQAWLDWGADRGII